MTSETKKFIEPKDIIGIRLECTHCKAALLLPFSGFSGLLDLERLRICPHCQRPWTQLPDGATAETAILQCVEKVRSLNTLLENGRYGFGLTLEIKDDEPEKRL